MLFLYFALEHFYLNERILVSNVDFRRKGDSEVVARIKETGRPEVPAFS